MDKELKELEHLGVISSNQSLPSMKTHGKGDEHRGLYVYLRPCKLAYIYIYICLPTCVCI